MKRTIAAVLLGAIVLSGCADRYEGEEAAQIKLDSVRSFQPTTTLPPVAPAAPEAVVGTIVTRDGFQWRTEARTDQGKVVKVNVPYTPAATLPPTPPSTTPVTVVIPTPTTTTVVEDDEIGRQPWTTPPPEQSTTTQVPVVNETTTSTVPESTTTVPGRTEHPQCTNPNYGPDCTPPTSNPPFITGPGGPNHRPIDMPYHQCPSYLPENLPEDCK